ncbi:MAG: hypothetical protein ACJATN_002904, partial [Neolewinella sp.]
RIWGKERQNTLPLRTVSYPRQSDEMLQFQKDCVLKQQGWSLRTLYN